MSGTVLKIFALVAMTLDHIGLVLFPQVEVFRLIGRLAFPIFAYMIAEGCYHTRRMGKYFLTVTAVGAVCQVAYYVAMNSLYMCVLVSFSLSIFLIGLVKFAQKGNGFGRWLLPLLGIAGVYFLTEILPIVLKNTDYCIDYGFWGVMLPVAIYLGRTKGEKLIFASLMLLALGMTYGGVQIYGLLAIPFLALYNGKRGKGLGKYFFYIYYPAHLLVIQGISYFL